MEKKKKITVFFFFWNDKFVSDLIQLNLSAVYSFFNIIFQKISPYFKYYFNIILKWFYACDQQLILFLYWNFVYVLTAKTANKKLVVRKIFFKWSECRKVTELKTKLFNLCSYQNITRFLNIQIATKKNKDGCKN